MMIERTFEIKMKVALVGDDDEIESIVDSLKRIEHHIENFVDVDGWPELDTIWDVRVEELKEE